MQHVQGGGLGGNQSKMFKDGPMGGFFMGNKRQSKADNQAAVVGPPAMSQNVRVKLPENDNELDDMSDIDPQAEDLELEQERKKIKKQAEMRRSK